MPIHLIWGDDYGTSNRSIEKLIQKILDPNWESINLSRLDGANHTQLSSSLEEVRTPPFGSGGRVIILKRSPFCNGCTAEIASKFEAVIDLIPDNVHLILQNTNKPDKRLKTTKRIQKLIKENRAFESSFLLPAVWDIQGQKKVIEQIAVELNLKLEPNAIIAIIEAVGNDSSIVYSELQKLSLLAEATKSWSAKENSQKLITEEMVRSLIHGISTNALEIA